MSYTVADATAWVSDESGTIHVTQLATGATRELGGAAATLFRDLVAGADPVAAAAARWPRDKSAARSARHLLDELVADGYLVAPRPGGAGPLSEVTPQAAHAPRPGHFVVLFVCTANICRSAYAEAYATSLGAVGLVFRSAGTRALVGQPLDPPMAAQLGMPTTHRAAQLTFAVANAADLVLAMSDEHRGYILDDWPGLAPRTFLLGHAARELRQLPSSATAADVAPYLWRHRTRRSDDPVRDPYRRGDAAAAECAATIRRHVDTVVRSLASRGAP